MLAALLSRCTTPRLVDVLELRIYYVIARCGSVALTLRRRPTRLLPCLRDTPGGFGQSRDTLLYRVQIVRRHGAAQSADRVVDALPICRSQLVTGLLEFLFHAIDEGVCLIARLDQFSAFAILGRMLFGFSDHLLDFLLGQATGCLDADLLFLPGGLVARRHIDDTIGIDVERDFNLWRATRCRRNADKIELSQELVVCREFPLALEHANGDGLLVVLGGGEHLAPLGRYGRVALDQLGHHSTKRFDAE